MAEEHLQLYWAGLSLSYKREIWEGLIPGQDITVSWAAVDKAVRSTALRCPDLTIHRNAMERVCERVGLGKSWATFKRSSQTPRKFYDFRAPKLPESLALWGEPGLIALE